MKEFILGIGSWLAFGYLWMLIIMNVDVTLLAPLMGAPTAYLFWAIIFASRDPEKFSNNVGWFFGSRGKNNTKHECPNCGWKYD